MSQTAKGQLQNWLQYTEDLWAKLHPQDRTDVLAEMRATLSRLKSSAASQYDKHSAAAFTAPPPHAPR